MRPHGRAKVSTRNPQAFGICDRCSFLYNHNQLQWQFDWAGAGLINKRILVCNTCLDTPQEQLRAIILPADPTPILNPRVQNYREAEVDYRVTQGNTVNTLTGLPVIGGDIRETNPTQLPIYNYGQLMLEDVVAYLMQENDIYLINLEPASGSSLPAAEYLRVVQQTGEPYYGLNPEPGTDPNAPGNDDPGLPYENVVVPATGEDF
jgi:hypothetical protein